MQLLVQGEHVRNPDCHTQGLFSKKWFVAQQPACPAYCNVNAK
jgi:hypothetical protein